MTNEENRWQFCFGTAILINDGANMVKYALMIIKTIGMAALIWHFSRNTINLSSLGVFIYIAIIVTIAIVFGILGKIYSNVSGKNYHEVLKTGKVSNRSYFSNKRKLLISMLLVPGEDGVFLLPLLYLPHSQVLFAGISIAFGFAHIRTSSSLGCLIKSISWYLTIIYVLFPFGIESCIVGHLLTDVFAICVHQLTISKDE